MRGLKYLFTVPTGEKVTEKHLRRVLASSVCGILLCMFCLVSTTWAWFTTTIEVKDNVLQLGTVGCEVTVQTSAGHAVEPLNGSYSLTAGETYTVTIKNTGDVKGYYKLWLNNVANFTDEVTAQDVLTLNLTAYEQATMTVVPAWGTPPTETLGATLEIGQKPAETSTDESAGSGDSPSSDAPVQSDPGASETPGAAVDPNGSTTESTPGATESSDPSETTEGDTSGAADPSTDPTGNSTETTDPEDPADPSQDPSESTTESTGSAAQ